MPNIFADRVCETSTTTGTGTLTLDGAVTGYRRFSAVLSNGQTCYYYVEAVDANGVPTGEWEVGTGTWSTGHTLARTTPISGSAATPVSFSAGTKRVGLTVAAQYFDRPSAQVPGGPYLA